jgi:gliding motility-associated-like protein
MNTRVLFFSALVFFAGTGIAPHYSYAQTQTLYNQKSIITVAPNTTVTVAGSVRNGGTLENNGALNVEGAWTNSGVYLAGSGQITFNGTSATLPQIIHHNGQSFSRVIISGGGKKVILSDMVIGREIDFKEGIVETSGDSKVIFQRDVIVSGASDRSHIHGPVYEKGGGAKLFPIGNGLYYLPVSFVDVGDTSALIGVRGFEFEQSGLRKEEALPSISDQRYWFIDVAKGSLTNSQVVLPFRNESWATNPDNIVVVQAPAPTGKFSSIGRALTDRNTDNARITSAEMVTMPFVALATEAADRPIIVYNAVSPNGDGLNDFLRIGNIENFPQNKFSLFNRWGDKVFEVEDYDNVERVFRGRSENYGELVSGTYFYILDLPGAESLRGFISVKN